MQRCISYKYSKGTMNQGTKNSKIKSFSIYVSVSTQILFSCHKTTVSNFSFLINNLRSRCPESTEFALTSTAAAARTANVDSWLT